MKKETIKICKNSDCGILYILDESFCQTKYYDLCPVCRAKLKEKIKK